MITSPRSFIHGRVALKFAALSACAAVSFAGCSSASKSAQNPGPSAPGQPSTSAAQPATPAVAQAPAKAADGATIAATNRECKRDSEVRKLSIEKISPKGCKLQYEKLGVKSVVASSAVGTSHCESVEKRIRENLTAAGYKCTE